MELIKILNRLGHGISYSQLEEIETALCLQKLEKEDDLGVVTLSNIHPSIPTCLAYDNIERNEETLSGAGTSHRVDSIAIQAQVHANYLNYFTDCICFFHLMVPLQSHLVDSIAAIRLLILFFIIILGTRGSIAPRE